MEDWPLDYWDRAAALLRHGLVARLKVAVEQDFVSLHVQVFTGTTLRHTPWQRHVTLGFVQEISPELLKRVRQKWHRRIVRLRFSRVGGGGSGILGGCPLSRCRLVKLAHKQGYYRDRELHISF